MGVGLEIPMPPEELRKVVGPTDPAHYDNPTGQLAIDLPGDEERQAYLHKRVFDFGCGCGRQARQLMLQDTPPEQYVGVDISPELVEWCRENLTPVNPSFTFHHHDVWNRTYAPGNSKELVRALDFEPGRFTVANGHSTFSHLLDFQAEFYLRELMRLIEPDGVIRSTWFIFNHRAIAVDSVALYTSHVDPTRAVYLAWEWLQELVEGLSLRVEAHRWPTSPGKQSLLVLTRERGESIHDLTPPATVLGFSS